LLRLRHGREAWIWRGRNPSTSRGEMGTGAEAGTGSVRCWRNREKGSLGRSNELYRKARSSIFPEGKKSVTHMST
jgi:hypothetical protein